MGNSNSQRAAWKRSVTLMEYILHSGMSRNLPRPACISAWYVCHSFLSQSTLIILKEIYVYDIAMFVHSYEHDSYM
jgi:hypothetical protein